MRVAVLMESVVVALNEVESSSCLLRSMEMDSVVIRVRSGGALISYE